MPVTVRASEARLREAQDVNPDPRIVEVNITARIAEVCNRKRDQFADVTTAVGGREPHRVQPRRAWAQVGHRGGLERLHLADRQAKQVFARVGAGRFLLLGLRRPRRLPQHPLRRQLRRYKRRLPPPTAAAPTRPSTSSSSVAAPAATRPPSAPPTWA